MNINGDDFCCRAATQKKTKKRNWNQRRTTAQRTPMWIYRNSQLYRKNMAQTRTTPRRGHEVESRGLYLRVSGEGKPDEYGSDVSCCFWFAEWISESVSMDGFTKKNRVFILPKLPFSSSIFTKKKKIIF